METGEKAHILDQPIYTAYSLFETIFIKIGDKVVFGLFTQFRQQSNPRFIITAAGCRCMNDFAMDVLTAIRHLPTLQHCSRVSFQVKMKIRRIPISYTHSLLGTLFYDCVLNHV